MKRFTIKNLMIVSALMLSLHVYAGDGTKANPYTIAEAIANQGASTDSWVKGYIMGCLKNGASPSFTDPNEIEIAAPFTGSTTVFLSDNASDTNYQNWLCAKLNDQIKDFPGVDGLRGTVGLDRNPENLGKQLLIGGKLKAMFTNLKGIREIAGWELLGGEVTISSTQANALSAYTADGVVYVPATAGQNIVVTNVAGQVVANVVAESDVTAINNLPANQILLVKAGNQVAKVIR